MTARWSRHWPPRRPFEGNSGAMSEDALPRRHTRLTTDARNCLAGRYTREVWR